MSRYGRYDIRIAYHHTDAMGVVHHSNHIKFFEEARVAYLRENNIKWHDRQDGEIVFAVVSLSTKYIKPARFDDELQVVSQARLNGARVNFQYALFSKTNKSLVALGTTELIALDTDFKPRRIPRDTLEAFRDLAWDDTWPPEF